MGEKPKEIARVVFDTNVAVSALLFSTGRLAWLRGAWRSSCVPLVSRENVTELIRVLSYPKFRLSEDERRELLSDYLPYSEIVVLPHRWPKLPACRDPDDALFLAIARVGDAEMLVTGDSDLLSVRGFQIPILTPEALRQRMPG